MKNNFWYARVCQTRVDCWWRSKLRLKACGEVADPRLKLKIINIPEKPELLNLAKDIKFVGMAQENALYYTFGYKKAQKVGGSQAARYLGNLKSPECFLRLGLQICGWLLNVSAMLWETWQKNIFKIKHSFKMLRGKASPTSCFKRHWNIYWLCTDNFS